MNEGVIKFIEWIGINQYYKSERTGDWQRMHYMYGNITHSEKIANSTKELYELYKNNKLCGKK